jgi:hypothetical protein
MSLDITALHNEIIYLQPALSLFSLSLSAPPTPSFYADSKATPFPLFSLKRRRRKKILLLPFFFSSVSSSQSPTLPNATEQLWKSLPTEVCSSDGRSKEIRRVREKHFPHPTPLFWGLYSSLIPLSLRSFAKKKSF